MKKVIHYNDLISININREKLLKKGFKFINRTNKYKKILAYSLIAIGCLTLPLPTGSMALIIIGLGMLGLRKEDLKRYYKLIIYKQKAKRGNRIK